MEETTRSGLMRTSDVVHYTGISRITIYRLRCAGKFPPPRQICEGLNLWRREDIEEFVKNLPAHDPVAPSKTLEKRASPSPRLAKRKSRASPEQGRLL